MKFSAMVVLAFLLCHELATAQHCRKVDVDASTGFCTVPDHKLTPGKMDAALVCKTNEDRPRKVTDAEKKAILAAYGYPGDTDKSKGEFDHWMPHWMGGSDKQANIWFEMHEGKFGSLAKDKVELMLWHKVCEQKSMTLDEAKKAYLKGWTKLIPKH